MSSGLPPRPLRLSPLAADAPSRPYFPLTPHQTRTPDQAHVKVSSPMSQTSQAASTGSRLYGGASNAYYADYGGDESPFGRSLSRREHQSEVSTGGVLHTRATESEVSGHSTLVAGSIMGERVTERRIKVPKRIIREDLYEKVIVIPERRLEEEIVETEEIVREKIIEIAKPIIQQKFVDVVEVEYRDKIVEVPEIRVEERITRIPRVEVVERVQRIPKIIRQEKIVEIPHTEYREIPVVRRVEVPQVQEQVVLKERPVTVYVDKAVPEYVDVAKPFDVHIKVPIPVAAEMVGDYEVPQLEQVVKKVPYNIFVPKFVEVPVPRALLNDFWSAQAMNTSDRVALLSDPKASMSLADLESFAADIHKQNALAKMQAHLERDGVNNLAARYIQGGFEVRAASNFVGSAQFARNINDAHGDSDFQNRGSRTKSRGRATGCIRARRRASVSQEQKSLWERLCPSWILSSSGGQRQRAACQDTHANRSLRQHNKNPAQPVSFGGMYPTLRAADEPHMRGRRYSSDSSSSGTSYCTSCSECNEQMQTLQSSVASHRR